ncbi:hypothetical protein ABT404_08980 [Streptomyces hyaluromycini]|uniref:SecA family profile domain-containing protein n=1 Tax=Streptomyces hyaluromycini TaxID=1377993 RepID=A0ABV1WRX9_9ACTN
MDARATARELKRQAEGGRPLEALSQPAFALLRRSSATISGVSFDEDVRQMAVRMADGTVIHGGRMAGEEHLRGARFLTGYLHTLSHGGVHLIASDERQALEEGELAAAVYGPLGVRVGVLREGMDAEERSAVYGADVTVGAYRRFGLDLLHDRQALTPRDDARQGVSAAVVKDPGHVLIAPIVEPLMLLEDDASPVEELQKTAWMAATLRGGQDYSIDTERGAVRLTAQGRKRLHDAFGVTDPASMETLLLEKRVMEAVAAAGCYAQGRDYDIADGTVVPLAAGTMPTGVRLRGGLLQAIETKEGLPVSDTQWITATVSVFEFFQRYSRVGGTSSAEVVFTAELEELFGLQVHDRRGPEELKTQQQHAPQMAAYLALNRQIAQWDRPGAQQRTELYDVRDRMGEPLELRALLHRLVETAVREQIRLGDGDFRKLQRQFGGSASELPLEQPSDTMLTRARTVCDDFLATDPDAQRRAVQSVLDQVAVYQAQAEMYYRDRYWPDELATFEEELTAVHDSLRTQFERAVARHVLHRD